MDPLTQGPVADLRMILQEGDESGGQEVTGPASAESPAQTGAQLVERPSASRVHPFGFSGQHYLHGLLDGVVPDGFIAARIAVIIPVK